MNDILLLEKRNRVYCVQCGYNWMPKTWTVLNKFYCPKCNSRNYGDPLGDKRLKSKRIESKVCKCGCGEIVNSHRHRDYIWGHNRRNKRQSESAREAIGNSKKGNKYFAGHRHSDEIIERLRKRDAGNKYGLGKGYTRLGVKHTEEHNRKSSLAMKGKQCSLGYRFTKEQKEKLALARAEYLSNPANIEKQIMASMRANRKLPNKPERKLFDILVGCCPRVFYYNGDARLGIMVGRRVPDFVTLVGKKMIIEMFGDFWHRGEDSQEIIRHYLRHGYQSIVIWEHELKNLSNVQDKVLELIHG